MEITCKYNFNNFSFHKTFSKKIKNLHKMISNKPNYFKKIVQFRKFFNNNIHYDKTIIIIFMNNVLKLKFNSCTSLLYIYVFFFSLIDKLNYNTYDSSYFFQLTIYIFSSVFLNTSILLFNIKIQLIILNNNLVLKSESLDAKYSIRFFTLFDIICDSFQFLE